MTSSRWSLALVVVLLGCAQGPADVAGVDELDADATIGDVDELEAASDVAPDTRDAGDLEAETDDAAADTADTRLELDTRDTAPADTPCVQKCIVDGGLTLRAFCAKGSDCCSGRCDIVDPGTPLQAYRCVPPSDPCAGCWRECPPP